MKFLIVSLFLMALVGCKTTPTRPVDPTKPEPTPTGLMSKEEVLSAFGATVQEEMADPAGELERERNLIPMNELVTPADDREIKAIYKAQRKIQDIATLPEDSDLRSFDSSVKSQWNGTCTAFGLTATQEANLCKEAAKCGQNLSERHRWSFYAQYSALAALKTYNLPVAPESVWPQSESGRPSNVSTYAKFKFSGYRILRTKEEVLASLASGKHVYFWSQTPKDMLGCKKAIKSNAMASGGHAYMISGYFRKSDPILMVKNSWGTSCADKGYQYMLFSIFDKAGYWGAAEIGDQIVL